MGAEFRGGGERMYRGKIMAFAADHLNVGRSTKTRSRMRTNAYTESLSRSQPVSFENDFFSAWWIRLSLFFFALSRYIKRRWRHS